MTPEERFNQIEGLLACHAQEMEKQSEIIRGLLATSDKRDREIDRQNEAIRSLIVVGRTCLDSIREMGEKHDRVHDRLEAEIDKLRDAQAVTGEKLKILVDTVDRIIRHRNQS